MSNIDKSRFRLPPVYPITDSRISGLSHTEQVRRLIDGGARFIQLREKHVAARDFFRDASAAISYAHQNQALIVINDRIDIAVATGADGVHLGQTDLPPEAARRLLGNDAIIGFSTHSVEQLKDALRMPIDYIAIGPIFPTSTKENPNPTVGIDGITMAKYFVGDTPLVAIGGITAANAKSVLVRGADSAAIISDLLRKPREISNRYQEMLNIVCQG